MISGANPAEWWDGGVQGLQGHPRNDRSCPLQMQLPRVGTHEGEAWPGPVRASEGDHAGPGTPFPQPLQDPWGVGDLGTVLRQHIRDSKLMKPTEVGGLVRSLNERRCVGV